MPATVPPSNLKAIRAAGLSLPDEVVGVVAARALAKFAWLWENFPRKRPSPRMEEFLLATERRAAFPSVLGRLKPVAARSSTTSSTAKEGPIKERASATKSSRFMVSSSVKVGQRDPQRLWTPVDLPKDRGHLALVEGGTRAIFAHDGRRKQDRGHLALVEGGTPSIPDVAATPSRT